MKLIRPVEVFQRGPRFRREARSGDDLDVRILQ